jgi:hypothetical protein
MDERGPELSISFLMFHIDPPLIPWVICIEPLSSSRILHRELDNKGVLFLVLVLSLH